MCEAVELLSSKVGLFSCILHSLPVLTFLLSPSPLFPLLSPLLSLFLLPISLSLQDNMERVEKAFLLLFCLSGVDLLSSQDRQRHTQTVTVSRHVVDACTVIDVCVECIMCRVCCVWGVVWSVS